MLHICGTDKIKRFFQIRAAVQSQNPLGPAAARAVVVGFALYGSPAPGSTHFEKPSSLVATLGATAATGVSLARDRFSFDGQLFAHLDDRCVWEQFL